MLSISEYLKKHMSNTPDTDELIKRCVKVCKAKPESVARILRNLKRTETVETPKTEINVDYAENNATVTTKSLNIKTLDDALRVSSVDLSKWDVDRYVINSWEVTMGKNNTDTNRPETYTNYQVKAWLKRKIINPLQIAIEEFFKRYRPITCPAIRYPEIKDAKMLEICLFDHHFGCLAWRMETGVDYDLKIAKILYQNAITDLFNKSQHLHFEEIVLPIGSDFFHINDITNETPKNKNKLDTDARLAKVFECGIEAAVKGIETCLQKAPVHVLWVPGNHDGQTSYYLCQVLKHHFLNNKSVTVDVSPKARKYKKFGTSLIGYTHGDEEPWSKLPTLMADECRKQWGETQFHEWHVGHNHKKKEMQFVSADSYGSITVRMIQSLCGTDAWHYKKGYVNGNRAAEAFVWSKEQGLHGYFNSNLINKGEVL